MVESTEEMQVKEQLSELQPLVISSLSITLRSGVTINNIGTTKTPESILQLLNTQQKFWMLAAMDGSFTQTIRVSEIATVSATKLNELTLSMDIPTVLLLSKLL